MTAAWHQLNLEDVITDISSGNVKIKNSDYLERGKFPIIDQSKKYISGYYDDPKAVANTNSPVIVFGDHTRIVKYVDFPFCVGADGVKILKPIDALNSKYLYYILSSVEIPSAGYSRHFKYLKKLNIAIPPLDYQIHAVSILNHVNDLREKRRYSLLRLEEMQRAIFFDLMRFTEKPVIRLASRMPVAPKGFEFRKLLDVAQLATGHTPDRSDPSYWNGDIPWLTLGDIRDLDGSIAHETKEHTNLLGIANSSAVVLPAGTVCFSRTASIGFVTIAGRPMATSQDFVNWICGPNIDPVYLMWALKLSRNYLLKLATGSTHRTIYFPTIEEFAVAMPPIEQQRALAARVSEIDKIKAHYLAHLYRLDILFASLQHRAFRGEL